MSPDQQTAPPSIVPVVPVNVVQNTAVDPVRKWTSVAVIGCGLGLEVAAAVVASFHLGDPTPMATTGGTLFALGVAIIWDRQIPA